MDYIEAGRRLKAAIISYRLGRAGVDSTLREIPSHPGPGWADLAKDLDLDFADQLGAILSPKRPEGSGLC